LIVIHITLSSDSWLSETTACYGVLSGRSVAKTEMKWGRKGSPKRIN